MIRKILPCLVALGAVLIPTLVVGQVYPEVTIGTQVWMAKNLDVSTFRNGDPIPEAKTNEEWVKAGENQQPAWCYYFNNSANGAKYGKLYNWYAVNDSRGLAPTGWHVPTDEEWTILTVSLGGDEKAGAKMKSKNDWHDDGNGTNESGFSGLPGGVRVGKYFEAGRDGKFNNNIGTRGYWWSSTEDGTSNAWGRTQISWVDDVHRELFSKTWGFSVRCLRD